jgi:large-conductance mechanosensitive channel
MFEFLLGNSGLTIQQFQTQFKEFIIDNKLVGTAAGITIGITTKDVIESLVGDIIIPFFYLLAFQFGTKEIEFLPGKTAFDFTSFFKQIITWILSTLSVFIVVYYFFMSVIGINEKHIKAGSLDIPTSPHTNPHTNPQTNPHTNPHTNPQTPISPQTSTQTKKIQGNTIQPNRIVNTNYSKYNPL